MKRGGDGSESPPSEWEAISTYEQKYVSIIVLFLFIKST